MANKDENGKQASELPDAIKALLVADDEDDEFDRLFYAVMNHFEEEFGFAVTVFGGIFQVQNFMLAGQVELDGQTPLDVMAGADRTGSDEGRKKVKALLQSIMDQIPAFKDPIEEW